MSFALDALVIGVGWAHVLLAPYTKVEESFNLHATHDVLEYGVGPFRLHKYDHFTFPGVVPRTFIGSIALANLSQPVILAAGWAKLLTSKFDLQIVIRLVLSTLNASALCFMRRAVMRRFGRLTGLFFVLLCISQFHVPFWMGRTVPNMFAFFPVTLALAFYVDCTPHARHVSQSNMKKAITLLTFSAAVFRAELALLIIPLLARALLLGYIDIFTAVRTGFMSGAISAGLTVIVDTYMWERLLWPELNSILFNVYEGKSAEWGVSPFHAYFTNHLPKLLLTTLPLSILGLMQDSRVGSFLAPSLAFVFFMSFLGHKEWRFIVYVVPLFNVAAARALRWMVSLPKGTVLGRVLFLAAIGSLAVNFAVTGLFTSVSRANYPGGEALQLFNTMYANYTGPIHVHISNLAAQTGASLFLHEREDWIYDKTEGPPTNLAITHLVAEKKPRGYSWKEVAVVKGFDRVDWRNGLEVKAKDILWIVERR